MKQEKTHYQSDWAEIGARSPLQSSSPDKGGAQCVREIRVSGAEFRWVIRRNSFETDFYGLPMLELRLEVNDPGMAFLNPCLDDDGFCEVVRSETVRLMEDPGWGAAYLYSRLVKGEPLHAALVSSGFREVEQRSIYGCRFGELKSCPSESLRGEPLDFLTLADLTATRAASVREKIPILCREAFSRGYSRHFNDEFLLVIKPGIEYILLAMEQNFRDLEPGHFLVALSGAGKELCGFTVVGRKFGLEGDIYTQLLSAVSLPWRGRGIYRGFTGFLPRIFPGDAQLVNVTHTRNSSIRKAYSGSGRRHIADTVIIRRIYGD